MNTRDTVNVIWRRRQEISEDDFQPKTTGTLVLSSTVKLPTSLSKKGAKAKTQEFSSDSTKMTDRTVGEKRYSKSLFWTPSKCSDFWSGNKVLS